MAGEARSSVLACRLEAFRGSKINGTHRRVAVDLEVRRWTLSV